MLRSPRSLAGTCLLAAAATLAVPSAVSAAPPQGPDTIALETGSLPEGIAAGPGTTFFVGARRDGDIYVGDIRDDGVTRLVDNDAPAAAVGMSYDDRSGLLWVAGGGPLSRGEGTITAYDGAEPVFSYDVENAGFLNDVVVTDDAVYVTDSGNPFLVVVPLDASGRPTGDVDTRPLTGDYRQPAGFGANGIRELPDGDLVLVSGGVLYRVDPSTGAADRIEVHGRQLQAGDGLELSGSTLYVVNGYGGDEVAVLRLSDDLETAQAVGVIRDQELDRPTTGALIGDSLYVVNGRFGTLGSTPDAPVYVTRLRTR